MRFGGLVAVDDISFAARDRAVTAIIGPNGAGKTTVFNCLTGFYKPMIGRLTLHHPVHGSMLLERMEGFRIPQRAGVARTFQNVRLFGAMSVLENLIVAQHNTLMRASSFSIAGLLGLPRYRRAEREAVDLAVCWLEKVGLADRADWQASSLPYGDQRRLEIARAMCIKPILLCLDEPAAGLNPHETAALNALLRCDPRRREDRHPADRARYERGDGDLRPHRRARLRSQDRRGPAGAGAQRCGGDQGLPRRGGRRGTAARGSERPGAQCGRLRC